MTDGVQRVFGMEYRPIKDLEVLAPAGLKVCYVSIYRPVPSVGLATVRSRKWVLWWTGYCPSYWDPNACTCLYFNYDFPNLFLVLNPSLHLAIDTPLTNSCLPLVMSSPNKLIF